MAADLACRPKVAIVFGTRPEAIKLAPVFHTLRDRGAETLLINTGQHRELLTPVLELFGLASQHRLDAMVAGQSLHELTGALATSLGSIVSRDRPDYLIVQGDTTSAYAGALAAFYERIPVGHVEAGLRTGERYSPFPEEANRRLVSVLATHHFAPTAGAAENLRREAVQESDIMVTGNTVIDALRWVNETRGGELVEVLADLGIGQRRPYILMTTHRRENLGERMLEALLTVRDFLREHPDVDLVLPMHRNPGARNAVLEILEGEPNARLIEAQGYLQFVGLMKHCAFIVTDSGGIQEEAPYFGRRTIVLRDSTERPEAVESGVAKLVGTSRERVGAALRDAWDEVKDDPSAARPLSNPFGDGHAATRIVDRILEYLVRR